MKSQRIHALLARYLPLLFAAVLFVAWPTIAQEQQQTPLLVMISVDGMRPDYVTAADAHGAKIPQLRRFMKEGSYAVGVVGVVPTVTYQSHTTLVTGVWPTKHGIFGDTTFDPLQKNYQGWYWYAQDIRVPTLWDLAEQAGRTTAAFPVRRFLLAPSLGGRWEAHSTGPFCRRPSSAARTGNYPICRTCALRFSLWARAFLPDTR